MFRVDVLNRFKLAPAYTGYSADDMLMLMTPDQHTFVNAWMGSGGNNTQAGKAVRATNSGIKTYDNTPKGKRQEQRNNSAIAHNFLRQSLVFSYLYLKLNELRITTDKTTSRGFEAFVDKTEAIRDAALEAEDFGAAIRAHNEFGLLLGHKKETGEAGGRLSDAALIETIAKGNLELTRALSLQLGVKVLEHDGG